MSRGVITEVEIIDRTAAPASNRAKLALLAGALVLVLIVVAILTVRLDSEPEAAAAQGDPAPIVQLSYLDGTEATLADLRGTPVVLNFFADWCPACVAEMPDFERVHAALGDDVIFVGLDRSGTDAGSQGLIDSTGITFDVAVDRDGSIFQSFGGFAMPTTVFIAADGSVIDQHNGVIFEQDLTDRINALFFDD